MLKHVHIKGFKSIQDVSIDLAPLVVLFGPNTAGKSNFLEALLLLSRVATSRTLADAFGPPIRGYPLEAFSLRDSGLSALLSRKSASLSLKADIEPPPSSNGKKAHPLRYGVDLRIRPQTGELELVDEYLARLDRKREVVQRWPPRIEKSPDEPRLLIRRLGEAGKPRKERLPLKYTIASNRQFSGDKYVDFDSLRGELAAWRIYYLDPRVAMRAAQPPREVDDIGPTGEFIAPFLFRLKNSPEDASRFQAVKRAVRAAIPSIEDLDVDLDEKRGTLDVQIRQGGVPYSSRIISEGTLRVLALCAIAANPWPSALVAFEEPENGVHPRRIEVIAELLDAMAVQRKRQVIVTTHSPTFVAHMLQRHEASPERVMLLRCCQTAATTELVPFGRAGELFDQQDIREALIGKDDRTAAVEAAIVRGWFDG